MIRRVMELPPAAALRFGESTSQYIYKIGDALEHFSCFMPFQPGVLIAMGATKGVAVGQPNVQELYLKPGDTMEIGIEGLMTLRNPIVGPSALSVGAP
jgi:5-carboxymethyl-2-hydroxymuconate isomerase